MADALQAGAAARPVPPLPKHLEAGVYLGGYGSYRQRRAEDVHDDPYCRALALGDGTTTFLLLVLDLVGLSPYRLLALRRAAARQAALPLEHVLVACTHSHASPDTQGLWGGVPADYLALLHQRSLEAAAVALAGLSDANVEIATADVEGLARNRRGWDHTDTTLAVLRARRPDGSPVATLVNFACHPTVTPAANLRVSCDFPAGLVGALERELGGVAVYVNGAQGDSNPARGGDFAEAREMGDRLAARAVDALASAEPITPPLDVRERPVEIRFRTRMLPRGAMGMLAVGLPLVRLAARRGLLRRVCDRLAARGSNQTAQVLSALAMTSEGSLVSSGLGLRVRTRAGWLRMGETVQGFAAPGEVLTRLALPIKEALPGPHRLFLGLTNDTLGYFVPTDEWLSGRNNNYEESVSPGRAAGPALAAALHALAEES